jgi:hypothetical protein
MFLEVLGTLKDQTSILLEPKFACEEQQPSPHIMVLDQEINYVMYDSYPLDISIVGSGMENTHSLYRG